MRRKLRLLTLALLAPLGLFLTNCNSPGTTVYGESQPAVNAKPSLTTSEYVISPHDVVQVTVFQVPDLSKSVQVNGSGDATLPLIGPVHLAGKTTEQAQQEIAEKLGKKYIRSPQVTVLVTKSGQRVTINGAVKTPSVLTIDGKLTLSQAIAQAGGFSELANSNRVHMARVSDEQVKDVLYDLDKINSGIATDPVLQGGDIIVVEESNGRVVLKSMKDLLPFAVLAALI